MRNDLQNKKGKPKKSGKKIRAIERLLLLGAALGIVWWKRMPQQKKKNFEGKLQRIGRHFADYLIPHERNQYRPKVFHPHVAKHIVVFVLLFKVAIAGALFALYPSAARLTADVQQQMYQLINSYRQQKNSIPRRESGYLESVAYAKGSDMLANNYFSHFGADGKKPWQWIDTSQYPYKAMGENLAMDFCPAPAVLKAFQNSPTHDRNLVNTAYADIGIAVLNGYLDGHTTNLMVVFFGSEKPVVALASSQPKTVAPVEPAKTATTVATQPPKVADLPVPPPQQEPVTPVAPAPVTTTAPEKVQPTTTVAGAEIANDATGAGVTRAIAPQGISAGGGTYFGELVQGAHFSQGSLMQTITAWSDRFLGALLLVFIALFIINIVVKFRVQHVPTIANSVLLIATIAVLLYVNVHSAEALGEQIRILGFMLR